MGFLVIFFLGGGIVLAGFCFALFIFSSICRFSGALLSWGIHGRRSFFVFALCKNQARSGSEHVLYLLSHEKGPGATCATRRGYWTEQPGVVLWQIRGSAGWIPELASFPRYPVENSFLSAGHERGFPHRSVSCYPGFSFSRRAPSGGYFRGRRTATLP